MNRTHSVIYLEGVGYAISDEEIKVGDLRLDNVMHSVGTCINKEESIFLNQQKDRFKKVLFTINTRLDSLPLLVVEDEVEKLAEIYCNQIWGKYQNDYYSERKKLGTLTLEMKVREKDFIAGYKQAPKGYSEEDLRKAFKAGENFNSNPSVDLFIQSLSLPKLIESVEVEIDFKCETWCKECKAFDWSMCKDKYKLKSISTPEGLIVKAVSVTYKK